MIRRAVDIVTSAIALVLLAPVFAVVAILVERQSGRPVLFRQQRVGRYGRPFTMYKFRTMTQGSTGSQVTAAGDSRITEVGRRLRSTKLDELPQLWNVLRGDMSLVGPRPEVARYVQRWPEADRELILSVRPGITDPAATIYRREAELLAAQPDPESYYIDVVLPDKVRIYHDYVANRSGATDLRILLNTVRSVALG